MCRSVWGEELEGPARDVYVLAPIRCTDTEPFVHLAFTFQRNMAGHSITAARTGLPLPPPRQFFSKPGAGSRAAPRTLGDAHGAAKVFVEKRNTFIEVHIPLAFPAHHLLFRENCFRWTGIFTNPAIHTKIIDPNRWCICAGQRH